MNDMFINVCPNMYRSIVQCFKLGPSKKDLKRWVFLQEVMEIFSKDIFHLDFNRGITGVFPSMYTCQLSRVWRVITRYLHFPPLFFT